MSSAKQLLKEEFVPAALMIKTSFKRDREELVVKFFDYTPDFLVGFEKQIEKVKTVQQVLVLTEAQKKATSNLYLKAKDVNNEFNFLVSYFKKCDLDTKPLSKVKRDLSILNIEGAVDKINGVIQLIEVNKDVLVTKGMAADYTVELAADRDYLEAQNVLQNEVKNQVSILYNANKAEYDRLYKYISSIANDGKIFYKGKTKAKEYTIVKIIERMRSGNAGGTETPAGTTTTV